MLRSPSHWPTTWHLGLALLSVAAAGLVGIAAMRWAKGIEAEALEAWNDARARAAQPAPPTIAGRATTTILPPSSRIQDVVRDIARGAMGASLQVQSLTLADHPAAGTEPGHVVVTVQAVGAYPAYKQLIADLLARYPTLTLQSFNIRALDGQQDVRVDTQTVFVFFVRDGA